MSARKRSAADNSEVEKKKKKVEEGENATKELDRGQIRMMDALNEARNMILQSCPTTSAEILKQSDILMGLAAAARAIVVPAAEPQCAHELGREAKSALLRGTSGAKQ